MEEMQATLEETWDNSKKLVFAAVGLFSIALGIILVPVPLVPGWPLLVFGAYCIKLATE